MRVRIASAIVMVCLLSACGSPSERAARTGGAEASASASAQWLGPPVFLRAARRAPVTSADPRNEADHRNDASTALAFFNWQRQALGLPALERHPVLEASARAHAQYLLINNESGHTETPGRQAFTGQDVSQRIGHAEGPGHAQANAHARAYLHQGVQTGALAGGESEVLSVYGERYDEAQAIRQLFDAPYHRGVVLFDWEAAGEALATRADSSQHVLVVDFAGLRPVLAANELLAYPYDGQRGVATAWVDNETPDPLGEESVYFGRSVGYPITLSGGPNAQIDWRRAELKEASGRRVNCVLAPHGVVRSEMKANSQANAQNVQAASNSTAICTPIRPLRPGTWYQMQAEGRMRVSRFATAPFNLSWRFETAPVVGTAEGSAAGVPQAR